MNSDVCQTIKVEPDVPEDLEYEIKEEPDSDTEYEAPNILIYKNTKRQEYPEAFFDHDPLDLHEKASGSELYKCEICDKSFKRNQALAQHLKQHEQESSENEEKSEKIGAKQCKICRKKFQSRFNFHNF